MRRYRFLPRLFARYALSRVDPYSEAIYDVSPFLHVGFRQPLPWGALGRWEANADCDNLLAQGYVPIVAAGR